MDKEIIFAAASENAIAKDLSEIYKTILWPAPPENDPVAILIDFSKYASFSEVFHDICSYSLAKKIPIIFLDVTDSKLLAKQFGIGLKGKSIVLRRYIYYDVFDIVDLQYETKVNPTILVQGGRKRCVNKPECNNFLCVNPLSFNASKEINNIINTRFSLPTGYRGKPKLPEAQYNQIYVNIKYSNQICAGTNQKCNNETCLDIGMYSSSNPAYKYVSIRTLGKGFNSGHLTQNNRLEKMWFQGVLDMTIESANENIIMSSCQPKTASYTSSYMANSSINIGVDTKKFPAFSNKNNLENKLSSNICDCSITSTIGARKVQWEWCLDLLSKGIITTNSLGQASLVELPNAAISDLQPITDTLWYVKNTFTETVDFSIKFEENFYSLASSNAQASTNSCIGIIKSQTHIYGCYNNNLLTVDFSTLSM